MEILKFKLDFDEMAPRERRICMLLLGRIRNTTWPLVDISELGPEHELALDFAYSRCQLVIEELQALVEASYPENQS